MHIGEGLVTGDWGTLLLWTGWDAGTDGMGAKLPGGVEELAAAGPEAA